MRLIFDHRHFWCLNPERLGLRDMLAKMLATWPQGVRPKVHFSSPRTEMRQMMPKSRQTGKNELLNMASVMTGHADFINPFEFATFMRTATALDFDVMLEAKAKDLALIRLRPDLIRYAPDVAERFGLVPALQSQLNAEEESLMETDPTS